MEVFKGGMGLVVCVDCGQKVNHDVRVCPHCGRPGPVDADAIQALRERYEPRKVTKGEVERKAVKTVSVAGSNLRYACPIAGIVLIALGIIVLLSNHLFEFSHVFYQGEGVRAGAFLFWFLFANCTFSLGLALPVLANLRVPKAKPFAVLGLASVGITFVLYVLNNSFFNLIIPASELPWEEHWWIRDEVSVYCWRIGQFAQLLSLFCLVATCLFHRTKVLVFVALPFALLFGIHYLTSIFEVFNETFFWGMVLGNSTYFIVILLCSIATITDENQRRRGSSFDQSQQ